MKNAVDLLLADRLTPFTFVALADMVDLAIALGFPTMAERQIKVFRDMFAVSEFEIVVDEIPVRMYRGDGTVYEALYQSLYDPDGINNPVPPCTRRNFVNRPNI